MLEERAPSVRVWKKGHAARPSRWQYIEQEREPIYGRRLTSIRTPMTKRSRNPQSPPRPSGWPVPLLLLIAFALGAGTTWLALRGASTEPAAPVIESFLPPGGGRSTPSPRSTPRSRRPRRPMSHSSDQPTLPAPWPTGITTGRTGRTRSSTTKKRLRAEPITPMSGPISAIACVFSGNRKRLSNNTRSRKNKIQSTRTASSTRSASSPSCCTTTTVLKPPRRNSSPASRKARGRNQPGN